MHDVISKEIECLTTKLDSYISDIASADTCEVEKVTASICNLAKADYYCTVKKAMEEKPYEDIENFEGRYGYRPHMTGNYRMGFIPEMSNDYGIRYDGDYDHERMGYRPYIDQEPYIRDYLDYKKAKRHYTETHSMGDKEAMDKHMERHFDDIEKTLKEMWKDADPKLRMDMKDDLSALLKDLV